MKFSFSGLSQRYRRWQRYRRTLGELELMTDRDLADLGISRYDIRRIAQQAAGCRKFGSP
jgi:uncharacterized protein YjiS (DUF1127 family)